MLPRKPADQIVALGDSYSSGEGGSATGGVDYYRETDNNGGNAYRNACHRSPYTWSRQAVLSGRSRSVGALDESWNAAMDYHLLACSGAQTEHVLPTPAHLLPGESPVVNAWGDTNKGQYRDLSQLDRGFLDENTTMVTISIGGNDARFGDIAQHCGLWAGGAPCQGTTLPGDTASLSLAEPQIIDGKMRDSVKTVIEWVHRRAQGAKIVLMGYPRLLDNHGSCVAFVTYPGFAWSISSSEADWLNAMGDRMNDRFAEVAQLLRAQGINVVFADPRSDFDGQAVCGDPETVHRVVLDKTEGEQPSAVVSAQSFHPKISGYERYRHPFERAVG